MSIKSAPEVDCPPSAPEIGAKDQDDEALEDEVIDFAHVSVVCRSLLYHTRLSQP
jgi:hypothetical protein